MVTVKIGESERTQSEVDESWVNQQINRRRAEGLQVCVRVTIKANDVDIILTTPGCASGGGGVRRLTDDEQRVLELWQQRGLSQLNFTGGNLIAFLKQLGRLI